jgi:hypothetical protein
MNLLEALQSLLRGGAPKGHKDAWTGALFHRPTQQRRHGLRHRPYTKAPLLGESKKRRKMAAMSRKINRK